jgi:hypothetical protein
MQFKGHLDALEHIRAGLDALEGMPAEHLDTAALVDYGARLNAIRQRAEELDATVKAQLWAETAEGSPIRTLDGKSFRAVLSIVAAPRVDVTALREAHPRIAKRFTVAGSQHRVAFKALG